MRFYKRYLAPVLCLLTITACQKKDNTMPEPAKLEITIASPIAGHTYHMGDTVQLNAAFYYIAEIHAVAVAVTDSASGEELYDADQDLHTDKFYWQQTWVDTCTQPTTLLVTYTAIIGDNDSAVEKSITVYSNP